MKSFNRIRCLNNVVAELIDDYKLLNVTVADVATDHGYLSELLSRNKKINKVYATDISQQCLDKTKELILSCGLEKIETKLCDGLTEIDSADIVVVAGIGGYEIIKILSNQNITINDKKKCSLFVLQPSKNFVELREYLFNENVKILRDFIVKSAGKFYPIIVVDLDKENDLEKSIFNLYFGKDNSIKNLDFIDYLNDLINRFSFLENVHDNDDRVDIAIKRKIYNLAKELIKKYKGD